MHDTSSRKCQCKNRDPNATCYFCCAVANCLNLNCYKVCLNNLPEHMEHRVVPIRNYLDKLNCNPLFYFGNGCVKLILDNPSYTIPTRTDY